MGRRKLTLGKHCKGNLLRRLVAGHWEGDTVYSTRNGSKECLLTLVERSTRMELIIKIPDRTAKSVKEAFDKLERQLGSRLFRLIFLSVTFDNGTEFSDVLGLEKSILTKGNRTVLYFAHPYFSCERGKKTRSIPLTKPACEHLKYYLGLNYGKDSGDTHLVFYNITKGVVGPLFLDCINAFLHKYADMVKKECPKVPEDVHSHLFRRSNPSQRRRNRSSHYFQISGTCRNYYDDGICGT